MTVLCNGSQKLCFLVLSFLLPSALSWSTSTRLVVGRPSSSTNAERMPTLARSPVTVRRSRQRSYSLVCAVQARVVDIEDRASVQDLDLESNDNHIDNINNAEETAVFESSSLDPSEMDAKIQESTEKVLNGIFLAVCFGWAAYTILNIDAGMTRGWTQSEIALRIPLDNWSNYESSLMEKPIFTKTLINVVIYLLGDWLSQTVFQKKNILDFDVARTLKNGFIGLCFGPLVHEYYAFSDHILPPEEGIVTRVQKIFMDQTIYLTVKCSIYISAVGLLSGDDWETCKTTVKEKIGGVVITAWKFWPLVHCITYGVIPARHRILWVNSVDLIWNAILASQAQKEQPQDAEALASAEPKEVLLLEASTGEAENHNLTMAVPSDMFFAEQVIDESAASFSNGNQTDLHADSRTMQTSIKVAEDNVPEPMVSTAKAGGDPVP